jgi:hypothetical protein
VKNAARMRENVLEFDRAIRDAGAKTVLYMTWARKHAPQTQQAITQAYEGVGKEIGAVVVPVGEVWRQFMAKHDEPPLHDKDQGHPTLAGSYLAACVFLHAIFNQSSRGIELTTSGLPRDDQALLQHASEDYFITQSRSGKAKPAE